MELGLVAAIVGVLIAVAAGRVLDLQARIEAHAVRADINALRTAVTLTWLLDREQVQQGMDPRKVLERARGVELPVSGDEHPAAPGEWRYAADSGTLYYRPARSQAFPELEAEAQTAIRLRVVVEADGARVQVSPSLAD